MILVKSLAKDCLFHYSMCSGFYSLSFFSEMQQGMMYRAAFSVLLLIATVTAQLDGISGCGGSVKVSQGILK